MSSVNRHRGLVFPGSDDLTDNLALLQFCETTRRLIYAGAMELGASAAEVEARLRTLTGHVGGNNLGQMTGRHRALVVAKPMHEAHEHLVDASRCMVRTAAKFQELFAPELDAVGAGQGRPKFEFRAD